LFRAAALASDRFDTAGIIRRCTTLAADPVKGHSRTLAQRAVL
jgi:hypothetical protein